MARVGLQRHGGGIEKLKSLRFTGHKMEVSEFLTPMVDFTPSLPSVITQVMPMFIYKHCACISLV